MSATAARIALITGANKGIGFEVARQLVSHGFQVVLGARRRDAGRQAAAELAQNGGFDKLTTGGQTQFLEIDIANPASITRAAKQLAALVDHLDVLVNNAGILEDGKATAPDVDAGVVRRTFETNTLGPLLVTQAMLPLLLQAPDGARIVNVSSGAGLQHFQNGAQRRHPPVRRRPAHAPHRGQLGVSRLGAHRHGRGRRSARSAAGSRHHRLARHRGAGFAHRPFCPRPEGHWVVNALAISFTCNMSTNS